MNRHALARSAAPSRTLPHVLAVLCLALCSCAQDPSDPAVPLDPGTAGTAAVKQLTSFSFVRDYVPGTRDAHGRELSGSELMRLVAYRGELFASTSTFTDPRLYTGDPSYPGCQILRKPGSGRGWMVDVSFGRRYLRTDALEVVRFTRDAGGNLLPEPVEMLVAGIWDIGESLPGGRRFVTVAVRDDDTRTWTLSPVASVPVSDRGFASVRALKVHRDGVTGRESLFVGAANGGMFRGVYDPTVPGRIRWTGEDEVNSSFGRVHSMTVANGSLYASFDYGGLTVQGQQGGVFRRVDGPRPAWQRVYQNYDPRYPTWNQTARGITAVPAEDGSGSEVILVGVEWPPAPIIVRIEPHNDHRAVTELDYHAYFTGVFGRPPQILGGSAENPHAGVEAAALNYFEPFVHPETGETDHFVTLFLAHPDDPAEGRNGAFFLVRRAPGVYEWGEIPSGLPAGQHLRGSRTIERSPFPDEPNVWYFGGCLIGPDEQPPRPDMAWVYKGVFSPSTPPGSTRARVIDVQVARDTAQGRELQGVEWRAEWLAGSTDARGTFTGGTETMRLVSHEGLLFAGTGYWTDVPGHDPSPGAQILLKAGPDEPWEAAVSFPGAGRVNAMESLTFTRDRAGAALAAPERLLVADAAQVGSRARGPLLVYVRDDATGRWVESVVTAEAPLPYVRAFGLHRDTVTGVELALAGTGAGEIYSGLYDPAAPGGIRWNQVPEYRNPDFDGSPYHRVSAFCVANGRAYGSLSPRLVWREDGGSPWWHEVFRWEVKEGEAGEGLRGITAVRSADADHEVILGSLEGPGHILRIDPLAGHTAVVELDSRSFLGEMWGGRVIAGGLTAYNRFVPGSHPETGAPIHWVTIAAVRPEDPRAAWLLVRSADATYDLVRVFDPTLRDHPTLVSTRTIEPSPWADDEVYTGGYDGAASSRANHNTAWIFRGRWARVAGMPWPAATATIGTATPPGTSPAAWSHRPLARAFATPDRASVVGGRVAKERAGRW